MSHVADGELHAYLDGALEFYPPRQAKRIRDHLERCAECRKRIEVETQLVGAARTVLGEAAATQSAPPPLEELRRRAELGEVAAPPTPARAPWQMRWAWAATIVLALGIGWGVGAWPGSRGRTAPVERAAVEPAAQLEAEGAGALGDAAQPSATVVAPAPVAERDRLAENGAPARSESASDREVAPPTIAVSPPSAAGARGAAAEESVGAAKAIEVPTEMGQASAAERALERRPAPQLTTEEVRADTRVAGALPEVPAPPAAGAASGAGQGSAPADPSARSARSRQVGRGGADRATVGQQRITVGPVRDLRLSGVRPEPDQPAAPPADAAPQTAAERVGSLPAVPPVTLPGLLVLSAEWRHAANDVGMLVRQRMENGSEVHLRLYGDWLVEKTPGLSLDEVVATGSAGASRAGSEAAAGPALPEHIANLERALPSGWQQVIRRYRGGWVVAQGPVSAATLGGLLDAAGVP
jgi:hypothetical protein